MRALLSFFRRNKEEDKDEIIAAEHPDLSPPEVPESISIPATPLQFPAEIEFPEIAHVSPAEAPDATESLIRRISWDERRFSQSMTEEG